MSHSASRVQKSEFGAAKSKIRPATEADHEQIWKIFREVIQPSDTYAIDPRISREDALAYWFATGTHTYVTELDRLNRSSSDRIVGTYILRPNQGGGGAHVANAAFMVAPEVQGYGIGRSMAEHCLVQARQLGFRAMQFNFVVSTNESALRLWQRLGFKIVGMLPGAFQHPVQGDVDVYVMHRAL
ncbi:MAG: GNAT family N-acetyltransferase [Chthoniobacterales bacterium]